MDSAAQEGRGETSERAQYRTNRMIGAWSTNLQGDVGELG